MAGCNKKRGHKPKMKTNRAAAKRFSVTGTGLVKFGSKGARHCLSNKSRKKLRQKRRANYMSKGDAGFVTVPKTGQPLSLAHGDRLLVGGALYRITVGA